MKTSVLMVSIFLVMVGFCFAQQVNTTPTPTTTGTTTGATQEKSSGEAFVELSSNGVQASRTARADMMMPKVGMMPKAPMMMPKMMAPAKMMTGR